MIQEKELAHVMRACMDENGMKFDEGEVDELTRCVLYLVSINGITYNGINRLFESKNYPD